MGIVFTGRGATYGGAAASAYERAKANGSSERDAHEAAAYAEHAEYAENQRKLYSSDHRDDYSPNVVGRKLSLWQHLKAALGF